MSPRFRDAYNWCRISRWQVYKAALFWGGLTIKDVVNHDFLLKEKERREKWQITEDTIG